MSDPIPAEAVRDDSDGDITDDDVPHDVVIQTALHDHLGGEWDALDGLVDACMDRLREYGRVIVWEAPTPVVKAAGGLVAVPAAALERLVRVAEYVSRGRGFVGVEPYPDATARAALGTLNDPKRSTRG